MHSIPSTKDLAAALVEHEGADPAFADVAASMILDGITFKDAHGRTHQSIRNLVLRHKEELPSFYIHKVATIETPVEDGKGDEPATSPSRPLTLTEKIAAEHRAAARSVDDGSNPWSRSSWNVTRQVALEHRDPTTAAQLKAHAK